MLSLKNREKIIFIIYNSTSHNGIIICPKELIRFTKSLNIGIFLSQLIYWSDKSKNDGWFFRKYKEWEDELTVSKYTVGRMAKKLEKFDRFFLRLFPFMRRYCWNIIVVARNKK